MLQFPANDSNLAGRKIDVITKATKIRLLLTSRLGDFGIDKALL